MSIHQYQLGDVEAFQAMQKKKHKNTTLEHKALAHECTQDPKKRLKHIVIMFPAGTTGNNRFFNGDSPSNPWKLQMQIQYARQDIDLDAIAKCKECNATAKCSCLDEDGDLKVLTVAMQQIIPYFTVDVALNQGQKSTGDKALEEEIDETADLMNELGFETVKRG